MPESAITSKNDIPALRPCPACKSKVELINGSVDGHPAEHVVCRPFFEDSPGCKFCAFPKSGFSAEQEAVRAWNRKVVRKRLVRCIRNTFLLLLLFFFLLLCLVFGLQKSGYTPEDFKCPCRAEEGDAMTILAPRLRSQNKKPF
jgi:hypothetical protein